MTTLQHNSDGFLTGDIIDPNQDSRLLETISNDIAELKDIAEAISRALVGKNELDNAEAQPPVAMPSLPSSDTVIPSVQVNLETLAQPLLSQNDNSTAVTNQESTLNEIWHGNQASRVSVADFTENNGSQVHRQSTTPLVQSQPLVGTNIGTHARDARGRFTGQGVAEPDLTQSDERRQRDNRGQFTVDNGQTPGERQEGQNAIREIVGALSDNDNLGLEETDPTIKSYQELNNIAAPVLNVASKIGGMAFEGANGLFSNVSGVVQNIASNISDAVDNSIRATNSTSTINGSDEPRLDQSQPLVGTNIGTHARDARGRFAGQGVAEPDFWQDDGQRQHNALPSHEISGNTDISNSQAVANSESTELFNGDNSPTIIPVEIVGTHPNPYANSGLINSQPLAIPNVELSNSETTNNIDSASHKPIRASNDRFSMVEIANTTSINHPGSQNDFNNFGGSNQSMSTPAEPVINNNGFSNDKRGNVIISILRQILTELRLSRENSAFAQASRSATEQGHEVDDKRTNGKTGMFAKLFNIGKQKPENQTVFEKQLATLREIDIDNDKEINHLKAIDVAMNGTLWIQLAGFLFKMALLPITLPFNIAKSIIKSRKDRREENAVNRMRKDIHEIWAHTKQMRLDLIAIRKKLKGDSELADTSDDASGGGILNLLMWLAPVVFAALASVGMAIVSGIVGLITIALPLIGSALAVIGPMLMSGIGAVLAALFSPIGIAIVAATLAWGLFTEEGREFFGRIGEFIISGLNSAIDLFSQTFPETTQAINDAWVAVAKLAQSVWVWLKEGFEPIIKAASGLFGWLKERWDGIIQSIGAVFDGFASFLKDKFGIDIKLIVDKVATSAGKALADTKDAVGQALEKAKIIGGQVFEGGKNAYSKTLDWTSRNIIEPVSGSLSSIIKGGESGKEGYDAYNRGTGLGSTGHRDISKMTIGEIKSYQALPKSDKNRLMAVGKYQMIPATLQEGVTALGIGDNEKFTPELQEKLFSKYLLDKKRPKISAYIKGKSDDAVGAGIAAAAEWRSIADPRTGKTYADKGAVGNKASISSATFKAAMDASREKYKELIVQGMDEDIAYQKAISSSTIMANAAMKSGISKPDSSKSGIGKPATSVTDSAPTKASESAVALVHSKPVTSSLSPTVSNAAKQDGFLKNYGIPTSPSLNFSLPMPKLTMPTMPSMPKLEKAPDINFPIASNVSDRQIKTTNIPIGDVGQDVPDRYIAHIVNGGIGGLL